LDYERIKSYFLKNGSTITNNKDEADNIVVVTCAFLGNRVEESSKLIRDMQKTDKKTIVTGCMPSMEENTFQKIKRKNVFAVPVTKMEEFDKFFPTFKIKFNQVTDAHNFEDKRDKEAVFLRISSGCSYNCGFCKIKKSVGQLKSKSLDEIKKEFDELLNTDCKYICLIADDVGAYGLDIGSSFPELLSELKEMLDKSGKDKGIRIGGVNGWWVVKYKNELLEILKKLKVSYFCVEIQSGSNNILSLMNRPYKIEDIEYFLRELKKNFPDMIIQTSFIVGYPGETEEDFNDTLNLIKKGYIDSVNIFKYFETPETPSAKIEPKVSFEIIERRYNLALGLLNEMGLTSTVPAE
jgi:ribosomal protein S12 methylthiotransferase